jgi:hypothetical protein
MACEWKYLNGGWVHFNVARPQKKKCAFCDQPDAKSLCDWPAITLVPLKIEPGCLAKGDVLAQRGGWRCEVTAVELRVQGLIVFGVTNVPTNAAYRRATGETYPRSIKFEITRGNLHHFYREALGTCDKPCCYRHRRHVDKDVDYCQDHWNLTDDVIAERDALLARFAKKAMHGKGAAA